MLPAVRAGLTLRPLTGRGARGAVGEVVPTGDRRGAGKRGHGEAVAARRQRRRRGRDRRGRVDREARGRHAAEQHRASPELKLVPVRPTLAPPAVVPLDGDSEVMAGAAVLR